MGRSSGSWGRTGRRRRHLAPSDSPIGATLVVNHNLIVAPIPTQLGVAMDEMKNMTKAERELFWIESMEEMCWIVGDWLPLWGLVATSEGDGTTARLRHIINTVVDLAIQTDRRLRDEAA